MMAVRRETVTTVEKRAGAMGTTWVGRDRIWMAAKMKPKKTMLTTPTTPK
jgi:hypothetical protein